MGSKEKKGSGALRDQLLKWKSTHEAPGEPAKQGQGPPRGKASERDRTAPTRGAATTGGKEPGSSPEEPPPSDEELFRQAVESVSDASAAILKKFDRSDARPSPPPGGGRREADEGPVTVSERALFLQAVGDMTPIDVERAKPGSHVAPKDADARFTRRAQRGEVEPGATIDLHGDDRARAKERLSVFLNAEQRARTEVVLVVHGKGAGILASQVAELLDEHPAVAEHVAAPSRLGGDGARLARLKTARGRGGPGR